MEDDIRADKSTAIPEEDFKSDTYIHRKKCLVMFFSRATPNRIQDKDAGPYRKKIVSIGKGDTAMAEEDVDIDIGKIHDFLLRQHSSTKDTMKPVFKLIRNPKVEEIDKRLEKLRTEGHEYGSFIFIICSYLDDDGKIEVWNGSISIDHFFDKIKSFESMAAKPKLFLIQADDKNMIDGRISKGPTPFDQVIVTKKIPTDADRIVIYSTIPQVIANRTKKSHDQPDQHTQGGKSVSQPTEVPELKSSFLVQAFIDVLSSNPDTDLLCNTPVINGKVLELFKELGVDRDIPIPSVKSTLTKRWFLGEKKHTA